MPISRKFKRKLRDPYKILAILSPIIGFVSLFDWGPYKSIIYSIFIFGTFLLILITSVYTIDWYLSRSGLRVFKNWELQSCFGYVQ